MNFDFHLIFKLMSPIFRHVTRIAKYIKSKRPGIKLFIWHDMLSQLVNSGYNNVSCIENFGLKFLIVDLNR